MGCLFVHRTSDWKHGVKRYSWLLFSVLFSDAAHAQSSGSGKPMYSIANDAHSTTDKKFVLQEIPGELPILVSNQHPEIAALINNYLYESLVAEELEEVYGDEDLPNGVEDEAPNLSVVGEELRDSADRGNAAEDLIIRGELDFYGQLNGQNILGLTIFFESASPISTGKNTYNSERNHFLFNAGTGMPISFLMLSKLLNYNPEVLEKKIMTDYATAVDVALQQPCLLEHADMAGLLKLNRNLSKMDLLPDDYVRSVPVYLRDKFLIFDRPILPNSFKSCDPMGIKIPVF